MFTARYYTTIITVAIGASAQFYSYGIVNPTQPILTDWINSTYKERNGVPMSISQFNVFWSFVVSSVSIGAIVGSLLTRWTAEHFGRRNGLLANGIVNVLGALLVTLTKVLHSPEMLIFGRVLLGTSMGLSSGLVPMYLMEITPLEYRGVAGTVHMVAVSFSDWFSLLIGLPEVMGNENLWPYAFGLPGLQALILCIILPFCPESPKYLLVANRNEQKAFTSVKQLVHEQHVQRFYDDVVSEASTSEEGSGSYGDLLMHSNLRIPMLISILMMISQQFTGCTVVFAYSTDMFMNAKLPVDIARYSTLAIGIVYFIFACAAPILIERVGRRSLSLFQLFSCDLALILLTIFTALQNYTTVKWASYGSIGALLFYMCVYGVGSPIPWMITGELFNTKHRAAAVTVAVFTAWTFAFIISTAYLPFQELVGVSWSYLPFIVFITISTFFVFLLLPETKRKPVDEILEEIKYRCQLFTHCYCLPKFNRLQTDEEKKPLTESVLPSNGYRSI
ncbi:Solute carrier family 2, facilitated glucose transporter member 3 [Toxocara canis]|uniref:Solute carrier family 2, facilitated glucose transporter member 3 n=1 Tax=Toxocara canis TaxID=6265 RepID=A0A0B2W3K1_TOXCA|nr:Solute carrier family 2, facilitated glucose transporter member 3 [Toxocara canis]